MLRPGLIPRLWDFLRSYLVTIVMLGIFTWTVVQVYVLGVGPTPQQPPPGFVEERLDTRLQWHQGNIDLPITVQVSKEDPAFKEPFYDKELTGNTLNVTDLEPGTTYHWRLVQGGKPSSTQTFKTSPNAVHF